MRNISKEYIQRVITRDHNDMNLKKQNIHFRSALHGLSNKAALAALAAFFSIG